MANDITPQARWSQQTIPPTSPHECVRALLNSPLGSNTWANPLRMGPFTIHDFWEVRREKGLPYKAWPIEPLQLAQLMLETGLKASEIDLAVRVEKIDRNQSLTAAMQMHRHLRKSHGLSTTFKDALDCLAIAFEAQPKQGSENNNSHVSRALRSRLYSNEAWTEALQSLTQYDNSPAAQEAYLIAIFQMFALEKKDLSADNVIPNKGIQRIIDENPPYIYGWDSTGSAMVQSFPQADNAVLTKMLHDKHDIHGLGAMVASKRLQFSSFLTLMATPASTPTPKRVERYKQAITEEEFRQTNITDVVYALVNVLTPSELLEQTHLAMKTSIHLSDAMQALVPEPKEASDIPTWWTWNSKLHALGLIDATKPSAQMQNHLSKLQQHMPTSARNSPSSLHVVADFFGGTFGQFANNNATLANMALAIFLYNVPRASKPSEMFETFKTMDFAWLAQADCARYITPAVLSDSQYGGKNILAAAAMILPHMSELDKVRIAPIVAYGLGVQSIQGLSPTTLRAMWKEQRPEEFKSVIPKQYSGDTYILFALTRKSADELMNTLSSMEVRHDVPSYLHCVEAWTRQAMALPPAIEDIGLTENLFGV